jgi:ferredoxin-type protein NapG
MMQGIDDKYEKRPAADERTGSDALEAPGASAAAADVPAEATPESLRDVPVNTPARPAAPPELNPGRRGFFAKCLSDILAPVASLIESRMEPVTDVFEGQFSPSSYDDDSSPMMPGLHRSMEPQTILRPPGAGPAGEFESLCSRCGACVEACPVKCIQIDASACVGDGYPYIAPAIAPCVICDELACMKACPTGALKLVDKFSIRMGLAEVKHETCLRHHGEDCRLCLEACPIGENAIVVSANSGRVLVKPGGCTGCGMCEQACPTHPTAITVQPPKRMEELPED